jgi:hypothetical protein
LVAGGAAALRSADEAVLSAAFSVFFLQAEMLAAAMRASETRAKVRKDCMDVGLPFAGPER